MQTNTSQSVTLRSRVHLSKIGGGRTRAETQIWTALLADGGEHVAKLSRWNVRIRLGGSSVNGWTCFGTGGRRRGTSFSQCLLLLLPSDSAGSAPLRRLRPSLWNEIRSRSIHSDEHHSWLFMTFRPSVNIIHLVSRYTPFNVRFERFCNSSYLPSLRLPLISRACLMSL